MQHSVPQFIDIEDKIFGPLSFRQAIYVAGGVGLGWTIFVMSGKFIPLLPFIIKVVLAIPPVAIGLALAFVKMNKRPFIFYVESFFKFQIKPKKFIWKKTSKRTVNDRVHKGKPENDIVGVDENYVPRITHSKIKNLALSLDMELDNKLSGLEVNSIK